MDAAWRGRWWLPGKRDLAVSGDLRLSQSEFTLEVDGRLPRPFQPWPESGVVSDAFEQVEESVILGESRTGERFTLLNCNAVVSMFNIGEVRREDWTPEVALMGEHLEEDWARAFDGIRCAFDYLPDWTTATVVAHEIFPDPGMGLLAKVSATAEGRVIGAANLRGGTVSLLVEPGFEFGAARAKLELRSLFKIDLKRPLSWQEAFEDWVRPLRDLTSFATVRANRILSMHLRPARSERWVELLVRLVDHDRPERSERNVVGPELLFGIRDLPGGFESAVRRWLHVRKRFGPVFIPLLGVGYAPHIFDDQRFLAFAQAAEVLHRIAVGGTPTPKTEHRKRVAQVRSGIVDPELSDWAGAILGGSNRLHLSDRLSQLVDGLGILKMPLTANDPGTFVRRVVKTRNFLTHRDKEHLQVLDGGDRYWHGQALEWIVRTWLLYEMGFGKIEGRERVANNLRYRSVVRNLASL